MGLIVDSRDDGLQTTVDIVRQNLEAGTDTYPKQFHLTAVLSDVRREIG